MRRLDSFVLRVFLGGLPVIVAAAIFASSVDPNTLALRSPAAQLSYNLAGLIFAIWIFFALYLCLRLLVSGEFRARTLTRLSLYRESDEREVHLSGRATRSVFLVSLAVLIALLCLSSVRVAVRALPPERAAAGRHNEVALRLAFDITDTEAGEAPLSASRDYFTLHGVPLSKQGIILLLIVLQIGGYNLAMRRLSRGPPRASA